MKKRLLYYIGSDAGFFSEYNNMVLAIRYCQRNDVNFILSSGGGGNFAYSHGWTDYFEPFCRERNIFHQQVMNPRYEAPLPTTGKRETLKRLVFNVVKHLYRIDLLTYDVFYTMREQVVDEALIEDCREINHRIWRYNPPTRAAIEERKRTLHLPKDYVGLHIRRGDKYREIGHTDIRQYMDKLAAQSSCREVFVATDDYAVYKELCSRYPDWHFHTLTPEQHKGYDQRTFEKYPKERKRDEMIALFTDIEVLAASSLFVGTLSSNIGMYLYWRLPKGKCIGVDYGDWQIW